MKKINKILLWFFITFFCFFIFANIVVAVFAKRIMVQQIEQNLKTRVSLDKISVSLPFSLNLINLEIGDLLKVERLSISANILGFLAGKIVLNRVTLINPVINLRLGRDGNLNLPKPEQKGKPPEIYLISLVVRNARLIFTDNKISPSGYQVILGKINADISKVMFPPTSLKANFKLSADVLNTSGNKLGGIMFSGWVDFGPKDMDGILNVKDLDLIYFSPYYGNFISNKKLLSARLNINTSLKSKNNNLDVTTKFRLTDLAYAKEEQVEGELPELNLTKNTLDLFTDNNGNLNLDFSINTKLDKPGVSVEQLKKMILKAAVKNLSSQSPETLIKKVSDNIEQFKEFGKALKGIFKDK